MQVSFTMVKLFTNHMGSVNTILILDFLQNMYFAKTISSEHTTRYLKLFSLVDREMKATSHPFA